MKHDCVNLRGVFASFLCIAQDSRPGCDEGCAHALLDRFVELGGNFIDTADVYQFGMSETIIGRWIEKHPKLRSKVKVCILVHSQAPVLARV